MAAVTVTTVAKKAAEVLASNKKGRKFLGYVVGIAVFILILPILMVYALFGWMAGDVDESFDVDAARAGIAQVSVIQHLETSYQNIASTFEQQGLTEADTAKAQAIYIKYLIDKNDDDQFYTNYAGCFLGTTKDKPVYALIDEKYGVQITEEHIKELDETFGETPIRVTEAEEPPPDPESGQQKG